MPGGHFLVVQSCSLELRLIVLGGVKALGSGAGLTGATKIPKRAGTGFSRVIFASEVPAATFIPVVYLASFPSHPPLPQNQMMEPGWRSSPHGALFPEKGEH